MLKVFCIKIDVVLLYSMYCKNSVCVCMLVSCWTQRVHTEMAHIIEGQFKVDIVYFDLCREAAMLHCQQRCCICSKS